MFVRRSTYHRDMTLLKIELMIASRAPGAVLSSEVLEGIRRQLLMALPKQEEESRLLLGRWSKRQRGSHTASAYHRLASLFMAAYSGQPGIGGFDDFRRAVIKAAKVRRKNLAILAEIHQWLEEGYNPEGVKSQLEDILTQQGVEIIRRVDERKGSSDDRFRFHGNGHSLDVKSPSYCITIEGKVHIVRQGEVECGVDPIKRDAVSANEDTSEESSKGED